MLASLAEDLCYQSKKLLHNLGREDKARENIPSLNIEYGSGTTYVIPDNAMVLYTISSKECLDMIINRKNQFTGNREEVIVALP